MIKTIKFFIIFSFIFNVCVPTSFAWKTNKGDPAGTHESLTRYAAVYFSSLKTCIESTDLNCGKLLEFGFDEELDEPLLWGKNKPVWEWLIYGADKEDAGRLINMATNSARFNNHFHNPLKAWENAGLDDWILIPPFYVQGKSSLLWAQDSEYQSDLNWLGSDKWPEGDWSWENTRKYFYKALTAQVENDRQDFFARTFRGLGHQAHLLEDKAVPMHVRNDAHPLPWHIESWISDNPNIILCLIEDHQILNPDTLNDCMQRGENGEVILDNAENPVLKFQQAEIILPGVLSLDTSKLTLDTSFTTKILAKTALLTDTDQYTGANPSASYSIGLAEYTNANFFSDDTIFKENYSPDNLHYFPSPSKAMTNLAELENNNILPKFVDSEDDIPDGVKCIKKNPPGEEIDCLVRAGYLTDLVDGQDSATYERTFILDAPSHESYIKHLVPRAVSYATALIDYFFRGRILVLDPKVTYGATGSMTKVELQIKNGTPSLDGTSQVELFVNGNVELIYSFIPPGNTEPVYHNAGVVRIIDNEGDAINTEYIPILASFDSNPVPLGASDFSITLVYRGLLGSEHDAVAARVYKFNSSRIAYTYQPGGQPNISNNFTISPDGSNPYQITSTVEPNPWYFSPAWSKDGTQMAFEVERCNDPTPNPNDPLCPAEYHLRNIVAIDLLSEFKYPNNIVLNEFNYNGESVANPTFSPDGTKIAALKRIESGWYYYASLVVFDLANNNQWVVNVDDDPTVTSLYGSTPAWSPAGDTIAYYLNSQYDETSSTMKFEGDLFLIDPYTSVKTRLTNDDFNNLQPSWSPDGEWIVFSSDRDGEASMDIWLMDKNGGNFTRVVDCTPASCYSPTFSPDGLYIAFTNGSSIYTVSRSGDLYSMQEIATPGLLTGSLRWSPYLVPPIFVDVQLEPTAIFAGGSTVLNWQTDRATEVLIQDVDGEQPVDGSIVLSPMSTTTYTLTANGPAGTTVTAVTVVVE